MAKLYTNQKLQRSVEGSYFLVAGSGLAEVFPDQDNVNVK
jgi:hypothetical protein